MSSKKQSHPQEDGGRGNICCCIQQAGLVPDPLPDSSTQQRGSGTQQRPTISWDQESLEAFKAYHRYMLESLQVNFDRVMAIAQQVTAAEHERDIHQRCSHVGGGQHGRQKN